MQPLFSGKISPSNSLEPIAQGSENSSAADHLFKEDNWIDPRFVLIFAKDGEQVSSCRSFKMNIQEIVEKYDIKQPDYMRRQTSDHKQTKAKFEKRAYKELLEFCADHLLNQKNERDPTRRKHFKTMYTLEG